MGRGRVEAFSDGVIAIIITIMVLELKAPAGDDLHDLLSLWPVFISYVLSFVYIAIYWNNHHHLLHTVYKVGATVMWSNLHLLFWMSLVPFTTAWLGEHEFALVPTLIYGGNLLGCALGYYLLEMAIKRHPENRLLSQAVKKDAKGLLSLAIYVTALALAFINPLLADALYVVVAVLWLVPDQRIERAVVAPYESG